MMAAFNTSHINALVCPGCYAQLVKGAQSWLCKSCNKTYPLIDAWQPVLFTKPKQAMFQAALSLADSQKKFQARKERARQLLNNGIRPKVFLSVLKADEHSISLIECLREKLINAGVNEDLMNKIGTIAHNKYDFHYGYLIRDWSQKEQFEPQFQHQLKVLLSIFKQFPLHGRVLFPGAASARLPLELGKYFEDCQIHALEASYSSVMLFYHLLEQDFDIYALGFKNAATPEAVVNKFTLTMPERLRNLSNRLHYQWADYQALPYTNDAFDWIVSVYFTDVLPFEQMIKETSRTLKKGGYFLHYGPLTWHSKALEQCYTLSELKALFVEHGYQLVYEDSVAYLDEYRENIFDENHLSFDLGYINFKNSIFLLKKTSS